MNMFNLGIIDLKGIVTQFVYISLVIMSDYDRNIQSISMFYDQENLGNTNIKFVIYNYISNLSYTYICTLNIKYEFNSLYATLKAM